MTASITVLRGMPRERQIAALRRMLDQNRERATLVEKHGRDIVREINRLKRQDAEEVGHVPRRRG